MIRDSKAFRSRTDKITPCLQRSICWLFEARSAEYAVPGKSLAVESGLRLQDGRTEVTPSRRLEVIGRLGARGCRGASWSEQLDGNFAERIPVFWTSQVFMAIAPFLHRMVC